MIKENQKILNSILVLIDGIIIAFSLVLAILTRFKSGFFNVEGNHLPFQAYLMSLIFIVPIYLILYKVYSLYTPYRTKTIFKEFRNIVKANFIGLSLLVTILFISKQIHYSRFVLFLFFIISILTTFIERLILRLILRKLRQKGFNLKHIIVIGSGDLAEEFIIKIFSNKYLGYNVVGIFDNDKDNGYQINGVPVIGNINNLNKYLDNNIIDEVIIALPLDEYDELNNIIDICEKCGVRSKVVPSYSQYISSDPYIDEVDGLHLIHMRHVPLDNYINKSIKRVIDLIISILSLIIFSPVMLFISITIKLTSPGPVLFKQNRVGENGREFCMYKFRSMDVQKEEVSSTKWTTEDDPRKTKFGDFIRKTSLDELPQLFNVLKGDMSLVGPRPERPFFVKKFKEEIPKYMVKHQVPPGITGWAQVNGWRGDTSISERIKYDIYYVENYSILFDFKILFFTIFKGFINRNAY
ncbi:undecaprenyl-phosphate glucose phosphotransferase [Orenia marismortui]|uniref:undecaprenyl-phosphate glucose phosphotransferase n=1 Tax=Orenia marismortui TaxID=46469 RepID=UPI0003626083|nr:undecaprenyl-phosphate glucose phosphotransferase [Orenia marismortui]